MRYMGAYPGVGACPGHYGNNITMYVTYNMQLYICTAVQ